MVYLKATARPKENSFLHKFGCSNSRDVSELEIRNFLLAKNVRVN